METELSRLEHQLEELVVLYESAKAEMRELRVRLAASELENRSLSARIAAAGEHIEAALARLPGGQPTEEAEEPAQ